MNTNYGNNYVEILVLSHNKEAKQSTAEYLKSIMHINKHLKRESEISIISKALGKEDLKRLNSNSNNTIKKFPAARWCGGTYNGKKEVNDLLRYLVKSIMETKKSQQIEMQNRLAHNNMNNMMVQALQGNDDDEEPCSKDTLQARMAEFNNMRNSVNKNAEQYKPSAFQPGVMNDGSMITPNMMNPKGNNDVPGTDAALLTSLLEGTTEGCNV